MVAKWIKILGLIQIGVVGVSFLLNILLSFFIGNAPRHQWSAECYYTDALFFGIECQNFFGYSIVEVFLNLPLYQLISIFFFYTSIQSFLITLALWTFPVLFAVLEILDSRETNA